MNSAFVTGASGFIGSHLTAALAAGGWRVEGVGRRQGLIAQDLAGIDTVFHLAGLAHAGAKGATRDDLFNVNVDQTVNLFRQAVAADVPRFVWLSSIKVLGDCSASPFSPEAPYRPLGDYALSKARAEQQLLAEPSSRTRLCIVRPPLVYGAGVKANFLGLLRLGLTSMPLPLKSATAPRAWLSVHNLVDLLIKLAGASFLPDSSIWHVRDNEETSVRGMLELIAGQAGRRVSLWPFNPKLAMVLARCIGCRDLAGRLFLPLQVDMGATRNALDWRPVQSQADAIGEVVRWYRTP